MKLKFNDLNVSSLDYTEIVSSMTNFLKQEPELSDLDFDNKASAVNMLINILATATAYNGVYAQFGYKESFLSTATLLPSVVGLASNSSVLLEVKKSAKATRTVSVSAGNNLPAFTVFPATATNGQYIMFFNIETVSAGSSGVRLALYSGSEILQSGDWNFTTQSLVMPITVDPETIKLYVTNSAGTTTEWTRVDKNDVTSSASGNYYTVLNTINGYLVTANLPNSNDIATSNTVFCRAVVSNGSLGNSATVLSNAYTSFSTYEIPAGGYDTIDVNLAKTKVQFDITSKHRCVTISDFESAIMASGIDGTDDLDLITVQNANEPSVVKIYVDGLSTSSANKLITYISERAVAGINVVYSQ